VVLTRSAGENEPKVERFPQYRTHLKGSGILLEGRGF
jgi:hypothetical protein